MCMAAYLLLPTGGDLTLGDVEAWVKKARSLGAESSSPVKFGEGSSEDGSHAPKLSVPVHVTRTVLPD